MRPAVTRQRSKKVRVENLSLSLRVCNIESQMIGVHDLGHFMSQFSCQPCRITVSLHGSDCRSQNQFYNSRNSTCEKQQITDRKTDNSSQSLADLTYHMLNVNLEVHHFFLVVDEW